MESFWQKTAPSAHTSTEETLGDADVAIIGAGFTGLGAAFELARAGLDVVVLEASRIGGGASGRNGGLVAPGTNGGYGATIRRLGRQAARELLDLSWETVHLIEDIGRSATVDIELSMPGRMELAADAEELDELMRVRELLREDGQAVSILAPDEIPGPLRDLYVGGLRKPGGMVHSARLALAMAERAVNAGARLYAPVTVRGFARDGDGDFRIQAGARTTRVRQLVLATNGFTHKLWPALPVTAQRGQVLATEPLPPMLACPIGARQGYEYYHQRQDGRLIVGGWRDLDFPAEETADVGLNEKIQAKLTEFSHRIAGRPVTIEARWSGTMGFTKDMMPIVGEVQDDLFVAAGFSGHGVVYAPLVGQLLGRRMLGQPASKLRHFRWDRPTLA